MLWFARSLDREGEHHEHRVSPHRSWTQHQRFHIKISWDNETWCIYIVLWIQRTVRSQVLNLSPWCRIGSSPLVCHEIEERQNVSVYQIHPMNISALFVGSKYRYRLAKTLYRTKHGSWSASFSRPIHQIFRRWSRQSGGRYVSSHGGKDIRWTSPPYSLGQRLEGCLM